MKCYNSQPCQGTEPIIAHVSWWMAASLRKFYGHALSYFDKGRWFWFYSEAFLRHENSFICVNSLETQRSVTLALRILLF